MPLKSTIHVFCPHCGKQQARETGAHGDAISFCSCPCSAPPGPHSPPRKLYKRDIILVGDIPPEEEDPCQVQITVAGPAGVGKTRLIFWLRRVLEESAEVHFQNPDVKGLDRNYCPEQWLRGQMLDLMRGKKVRIVEEMKSV